MLFGIIGVIGASTSPAWATEVEAGFDLFMTTDTTEVDLTGFGLGIVPLSVYFHNYNRNQNVYSHLLQL